MILHQTTVLLPLLIIFQYCRFALIYKLAKPIVKKEGTQTSLTENSGSKIGGKDSRQFTEGNGKGGLKTWN